MSKGGKRPAELQLDSHPPRSSFSFSGQYPCFFTYLLRLQLISRGPHEERWFGWRGGWELLRRPALVDLSPEALTEGPLHQEAGAVGTEAVVGTRSMTDLEVVGEGGEKKGTSLGPTRIDGPQV